MNWYVKIGDKQFHLHAVISVVVLALLIYFERAGGRSYFDEGLALLCMVYVMVLFLKGRLIVEDQISVLLLISVISIGLISNITSKLAYTWFSVFVDLIAETKFLWVLLLLNTISHLILTMIGLYITI